MFPGLEIPLCHFSLPAVVDRWMIPLDISCCPRSSGSIDDSVIAFERVGMIGRPMSWCVSITTAIDRWDAEMRRRSGISCLKTTLSM